MIPATYIPAGASALPEAAAAHKAAIEQAILAAGAGYWMEPAFGAPPAALPWGEEHAFIYAVPLGFALPAPPPGVTPLPAGVAAALQGTLA